MTEILLAVALAAACSAAYAKPSVSAQPLDYKGIVVGQPGDRETIAKAAGVECGDGTNGMTICSGIGSIADEVAEINIVMGKDGMVDRVYLTVSSDSFDHVAQSLVAKFGKPQRASRPVVQNGFGANFRGSEMQWDGRNGTQLYFDKLAGDTEHSTIYFSTIRDRKSPESLPSSDL